MLTTEEKIQKGHQMYREGRHSEALVFYTQALAMAKIRAQKIALHSNRAACYLKLHEFKKAAEECTSVLELDRKHTGALMLRAQTLVTMKEYHSALFDVSRLIELNPSSDAYRDLEARLKTQLSLPPIPESDEEESEEEKEELTRSESTAAPVTSDLAAADTKEVDHLAAAPDTKEVDGLAAAPDTKEVDGLAAASDTKAVDHLAAAPDIKAVDHKTESTNSKEQLKDSEMPIPTSHPTGWEAIPKPKGHSGLDYSRWDQVEDGSSDEDDDEDSQPQYRFRVRTVGVRPVSSEAVDVDNPVTSVDWLNLEYG
ncbi:Mitochondrial import receptor subunit [Nymphaea thermarum]|nr:Mitochondrial import receptor subunit [Nymphaea thermarum]